MRSTWLRFLIAFVMFNLATGQVMSASLCIDIMSSRTHIFRSSSSNQAQPLAKEVIERLRKHSIFDLAKQIPDGGKGLEFHFEVGLTNKWEVTKLSKGEGQQGLMLKSYLELLFPKASFKGKNFRPDATKQVIHIHIRDRAESKNAAKEVPENQYLDMPLLKAGNPGPARISRVTAREKWGIFKDRKVVHFYFVNENSILSDRAAFINRVRKTYPFDVLILSFGNMAEPGTTMKNYKIDKNLGVPFDRYLRLSETGREDFAKQGTIALFNDTTGFMHDVHSVADLAVVVGPINFFQPLAAGTPTLSVLTPHLTHDYNKKVLQRMTEQAEASGGYVKVTNMSGIEDAIGEVLAKDTPENPAFTQDSSGKSPFEKVLDALEHLVRSQI